MKLQSCASCGAQFDVSGFAPGQKFTCGSCGAVLTAHVGAKQAGAAPAAKPAAGRVPGSRPSAGRATSAGPKPAGPKAAGRATARGTAGASSTKSRGPQYRPPERVTGAPQGTAAGARPPKGGARGAAQGREDRGAVKVRGRGEARGRGESARPSRSGPNPAIIYGVGALLVVGVLAFLLFGGGDGPDAANGNGTSATNGSRGGGAEAVAQAPPSEDSLESLRAELADTRLKTAPQYKAFASRFLALGTEAGKAEAQKLYKDLIEQVASEDLEARKALGYVDFQTDILGRKLEEMEGPIPDSIANRRGYPFLDAVMDFHNRRWLKDDDEIEDARSAVREMQAHEQKLLSDHIYRAGDRIRANIATDNRLKDLNYITSWAAPYLIVYSSSDTLSEFDLRNIEDKEERKRKRAEMKEKRKDWEIVLREKAAIYTQLYEEWMRRYRERFELKDLTDEYGGRPDYKASDRSFADGVPFVIWIFTDEEAFHKYHEEKLGGRMPPGVAGYFNPENGWIFLFDDPGDDPSERVFEVNKNLHEGTHQLEYWFTRQRNRWGMPKPSQDSFSEGLAELLGTVQMDKARHLKFIEVNVPRLRNMQSVAETLKKANREYPIFPVEDLVSFGSYAEMQQWAASQSGWDPGLAQNAMAFFYQQSWAFTYFLNHFENGKYRDNWLAYFRAALDRQTGRGLNKAAFMRAFKIRDEDEWDEIQEDWEEYLKGTILKMNWKDYEYTPPKRKEWAGEEPE